MIYEADPSAWVFQEHVQPLLKRLPLLVVEHVLGLECLVDRQIDRVIRVWDTCLVQTRRLNLRRVHIVVYDVVLALLPPVLPFHRRGHPFVMRLAESGRSKPPEEGETAARRRGGLVHLRPVVLRVLRLASRRFQRRVLGLEAVLRDQLILARLEGRVSGGGARTLLGQPRALVLASWKTLVALTWTVFFFPAQLAQLARPPILHFILLFRIFSFFSLGFFFFSIYTMERYRYIRGTHVLEGGRGIMEFHGANLSNLKLQSFFA